MTDDEWINHLLRQIHELRQEIKQLRSALEQARAGRLDGEEVPYVVDDLATLARDEPPIFDRPFYMAGRPHADDLMLIDYQRLPPAPIDRPFYVGVGLEDSCNGCGVMPGKLHRRSCAVMARGFAAGDPDADLHAPHRVPSKHGVAFNLADVTRQMEAGAARLRALARDPLAIERELYLGLPPVCALCGVHGEHPPGSACANQNPFARDARLAYRKAMQDALDFGSGVVRVTVEDEDPLIRATRIAFKDRQR